MQINKISFKWIDMQKKRIISQLIIFLTLLSVSLFSCCRLCSEEIPVSVVVAETTLNPAPKEPPKEPPPENLHTPYFSDEEEPAVKPEEPKNITFGYLFWKMIILLACTIGFLYFAAWLAKKIMHKRIYDTGRAGRIQVIEQRVISPKSAIWIVQVGDSQYVLAEHTHTIRFLKEIPIEK